MQKSNLKTDILVYGNSEEYASFPMLTRTENELVLLFTVQPLDKLKAAKIHPHYQLFAQPRWAVSRDQGLTWTVTDYPPRIGPVQDTTFASAPLLDGGMVTLTFSAEPPSHALIEYGSVTYRPYLSTANTQATLIPLVDIGPFKHIYPHGIVRTSDGTLLAGGYANDPIPSNPNRTTVVFLCSHDEGRSWQYLSCIQNVNPFGFSEPALLAGNDGRVVSVFRTDWDRQTPKCDLPIDAGVSDETLGYYLYQSVSLDFGRTWNLPERLPFWGHPPHLKRFGNGDVLLLFGVRREPYGIQAVLSHDDGASWDLNTHRTVYKYQPGRYDLGYPVATILDDDSVVCTHYGYCSDDASWSETPHGVFVSIFDHEWLSALPK